MTDNHPITPPPELVRQWTEATRYKKGMAYPEGYEQCEQRLCTAAARWGADQELEACCEWLTSKGLDHFPMQGMREARRPTPPSLKEQALAVLDDVRAIDATHYNILRNALEALPND